jgi:hypothetical protein
MSDLPDRSPNPEGAWREHNLSQLRYFRSLTLRSRLEAVEGVADVIRRFEEMRRDGRFRKK